MAIMNLFSSSSQADEVCWVYCKAHANIRLQCQNSLLVKLKTATNREHIVWMDGDLAEQGVYSYVRAFYEPQDWADDDLSNVVSRILLRPDHDVFCYNDNTYYLYAAQNGNYQIRLLRAYYSQSVVEDMVRQNYSKKPPVSVFLVNFYTMDGNARNYVLTCWGISYENVTNYLPVFEEDYHYLTEYKPAHFVRRELSVGEVFKNNGYYYKVLKGQDGKLILEAAKSVFLFNKSSDLPQVEPAQEAQIISMNFKKQSGG